MPPKNNSRCQYLFFLFAGVVLLSCGLSQAQRPDRETSPLPDAAKPSIPEPKGFFARWGVFSPAAGRAAVASPPPPPPAPPRPPAPAASPPFPNSSWFFG